MDCNKRWRDGVSKRKRVGGRGISGIEREIVMKVKENAENEDGRIEGWREVK